MNNPDIISFYSNSQSGGELPYFVGKQYGTGWLKTIGRFALPILRRIGNFGMKTANDVLNNNSKILPALKSNAISEIKDSLPDVIHHLPQVISKVTDVFNENKTENKQNGGILKRKRNMKKHINKRMKGYGTIFEK